MIAYCVTSQVPVYWPPYPMHYGICANCLLLPQGRHMDYCRILARGQISNTSRRVLLISKFTNAAVNGQLELTLLKDRQRCDTVLTSKFRNGECSPNNFLDVVNLYLKNFKERWILNERAFCSFIILFIWKWIFT